MHFAEQVKPNNVRHFLLGFGNSGALITTSETLSLKTSLDGHEKGLIDHYLIDQFSKFSF